VPDSRLIDQAGSILLYVAPGFFARLSYQARFPQRESGDLYALVVSVAASVPVVAAGHALASWWSVSTAPTSIAYVAMLLTIAVVVGYLAAFVRDREFVRGGLRHIGLPYGPEATVIERTIFKMPVNAEVNVLFKDGRIASGIPTKGTNPADQGDTRELYLAWPRWWSEDGESWVNNTKADNSDEVAGMLVNLDEVAAVELKKEPQ